MYCSILRRQALRIGLLVTLVVFTHSACAGGGDGGAGGGEEQAKAKEQPKARPLPFFEEDLRPGEYHSVDFERSLSFRVGKGWKTTGPELPNFLELGHELEAGARRFTSNIEEVYKPGTMDLVKAPNTWSVGSITIPT